MTTLTPTGFGLQPAGLTAFGLGAPAGFPAQGETYVTADGLSAARRVDLRGRDVAADLDAFGAPFEPEEELEQNVVLRLTTRPGSLRFDPTFGNDFLALQKLPIDLDTVALRSAERALRDLTSSGQVAIVSVTTSREGSAAEEVVTWRDLRTGQERPATVRTR